MWLLGSSLSFSRASDTGCHSNKLYLAIKGDHMNTRTVTFEMPEGQEVEIEVEYSYSYDEGCYNGPMDKCYPSYDESELVLPINLSERLTAYFVANVLPEWVGCVERQARFIECDGQLAEWAHEDKESAAEAKADAYNDRMREGDL